LPCVALAKQGAPCYPFSADYLAEDRIRRRALVYYVYLLQSLSRPEQRYVGFTEDLRHRLKVHNDGASPHTSKYRPWQLVTYLSFSQKDPRRWLLSSISSRGRAMRLRIGDYGEGYHGRLSLSRQFLLEIAVPRNIPHVSKSSNFNIPFV
jgi:hypothetical protein